VAERRSNLCPRQRVEPLAGGDWHPEQGGTHPHRGGSGRGRHPRTGSHDWIDPLRRLRRAHTRQRRRPGCRAGRGAGRRTAPLRALGRARCPPHRGRPLPATPGPLRQLCYPVAAGSCSLQWLNLEGRLLAGGALCGDSTAAEPAGDRNSTRTLRWHRLRHAAGAGGVYDVQLGNTGRRPAGVSPLSRRTRRDVPRKTAGISGSLVTVRTRLSGCCGGLVSHRGPRTRPGRLPAGVAVRLRDDSVSHGIFGE